MSELLQLQRLPWKGDGGWKKVSKPNCCHTIKPKLVGQSKGKVNVFNLATRQLLSLVTSGLSLHFNPNGGCSLAGGCSSSVRNFETGFFNGQLLVETGALSRFNLMAVC